VSGEGDARPPAEALGGEERVAHALAALKAGVLQRRGELAAIGGGREQARVHLVELQRLEFVREPICASRRPLVGRALVFARKVFFHLFQKWYARPILQQQNDFNRAVSQVARGLAAGQEELATAVERLAARLDALERRGRAGDDGGDAPASP
jgi:hypothetical protein